MSLLLDATPAADFPDVYDNLLWRLIRRGTVERNTRTGKEVKALGPVAFKLDLSEGLLPVPGNRRVFPATAAAETAWYLMGTQDATFMLKHARVVWEKFVEPLWKDGLGEGIPTMDQGVKAAYGYRWRRHFKRDQLHLAIETLRRNPSDRRVWISAWDPAEDGLGAEGQLNVPCPVGFSLSILDGRLNSSYHLRSSDVFVGLPYDVMGHAILMDLLATELGFLGPGEMEFTLAHPHIYDVHWEMAHESFHHKKKPRVNLLNSGRTDPFFPWRVDDVVRSADIFVDLYKDEGRKAEWPEYCPKPEVVQ